MGKPTSEPQTLSYEAPRDQIARKREHRGWMPDSRLAIGACMLGAVEVAVMLWAGGWLLKRDDASARWILVICWFSSLCLGVPLSFGGMNEEERRKRFGVIGFLLHSAILITPCIILRQLGL